MKKKFIIINTVLLLLFLTIMILVTTNNISNFDSSIYNFIISLRCNSLDFYFKTITKLGNTMTVICILILLIFYLERKYKIMLGMSAISSVATNLVIKNIIRRPRPTHLRLITQGGFSFPSGHSMISVCVYGFLIYLVYKEVRDKKLKILLIAFFTILIISIGLSRIYVGVHYPSDVIAGYILSSSLLITVINLCNKYLRGNFNDKNSSK